MMSCVYLLDSALLATLGTLVHADGHLCISESKQFTIVVDLFASELASRSLAGYFTFKECPGMINPTIGMEMGESYTFVQADISNWMHPIGFAYFPDGAHNDKDELEPGITQTESTCVQDISCPTPRYFRGNEFLGVNGTEDFGLDIFEPEFFSPIPDWSSQEDYSIELTLSDSSYIKDIFYFCHVKFCR